MNSFKNFHKNSLKKKSKSLHDNDSDEESKEDLSQTESIIFPLIKKINSTECSMPTKNHRLMQCPLSYCNYKFYVFNDDLLDRSIVICPQGHNICAECLELAHFPISCQKRNEWLTTKFSNVENLEKMNFNTVECPSCGKLIKLSSDNLPSCKVRKEYCPTCNVPFCLKCMKLLFGFRIKHICIEKKDKGEKRTKAEKILSNLKALEDDYPIFENEKIKQEENLMKMRNYFENKPEKMNFNKEIISKVCCFVDGVNEIKNCIFLGEKFEISIQKERKKPKILKLVNEIKENYNLLEILNKNSQDSFDSLYKKFGVFEKDPNNLKILKRLKTLVLCLEQNYKK